MKIENYIATSFLEILINPNPMGLERSRKMELLHTPKLDLLRMMRENSLTVEEVIFLFGSNKVATADIRMNSPSICDKLPDNVFSPDSQTSDYPCYDCIAHICSFYL